MPAPVLYRSDDPSAPSYIGNTATLHNVLHACLVTGYGSQPAAGWTRESLVGQVGIYRPGGTGDRPYLRVNQSNVFQPVIRGFEQLVDAQNNNVANGFPSGAQVGGGGIGENVSNYSNPRAWWMVADDTTFYFAVSLLALASQVGAVLIGTSSVGAVKLAFAFGKFKSYVPGDQYNWFIFGGSGAGLGSGTESIIGEHYTMRNALGLPSQPFGKLFLGRADSIGASTGFSFPDVHTGAVRLQSKVTVIESVAGSNLWRGELPGLVFPLSNVAPLNWMTLDGTGSLAGRTFRFFPMPNSSLFAGFGFDTAQWSY